MRIISLSCLFVIACFSISTCEENIVFEIKTDLTTGLAKTGDDLGIYISLQNKTDNIIAGDLFFVILVPDGKLLFFPEFTAVVSSVPLTIPANISLKNVKIFEQSLGEWFLTQKGEYKIACGFMEKGSWISNIPISWFYLYDEDFFKLDNSNYEVAKWPFPVITEDFNNDELVDLIVNCDRYNTRIFVMINNGDNFTCEEAIFIEDTVNINQINTGDLDDDGYIDIIATNKWGEIFLSYNNMDGTFEEPVTLLSTYSICGEDYIRKTEIDDLNKDGLNDIACVTSSWNDDFTRLQCVLTIFINEGGRTFKEPYKYELSEDQHYYNQNSLLSDINGDGFSDIIVSLEEKKGLDIFINNTNGSFLFRESLDIAPVVLSDFNADGIDDLIGFKDGKYHLMMNNGNGYFEEKWSTMENSLFPHVISSDLNLDGIKDIVMFGTSYNETISIFLNRGNCVFEPEASYGIAQDVRIVHDPNYGPPIPSLADMNNDGYPDIIFANHDLAVFETGDLSIMLNNRDGTFKNAIRLGKAEGFIPIMPSITDLNNDGLMDIVTSIDKSEQMDASVWIFKNFGNF